VTVRVIQHRHGSASLRRVTEPSQASPAAVGLDRQGAVCASRTDALLDGRSLGF
jgi:hypothetical protein